MSKHTPGPWSVCCDSYGRVQHSRKYDCIARTEPDGGPYATIAQRIQNPADSLLIAAAPEMLAALEGLFEHCAMIHKSWGDGDNSKQAVAAQNAGRTAIAKARGEA